MFLLKICVSICFRDFFRLKTPPIYSSFQDPILKLTPPKAKFHVNQAKDSEISHNSYFPFFLGAQKLYHIDTLFTKKSEMLLAKKVSGYIKILLAYDSTICIELMYNMYKDNLTVGAIINSYFQYIGFNIVFLRGIIFGVHVYIYALMFDEIHGHAEQFFLPYRKLSPEFLKEYPIFDYLNKETMAENAVYQDSSRSRTPSLRKIKVRPMSK